MNVSPVQKPAHADGSGHALVLIDREPLSRDCFAEVLQAAFPNLMIAAASDVNDLGQTANLYVALVLLRLPAEVEEGTLAPRVIAVQRQFPHTPIVVIGPRYDRSLSAEAVDVGVRGLLPNSEPLKVVVAAIQLIIAGGTYYPIQVRPEAMAPGRPKLDTMPFVLDLDHDNAPARGFNDDTDAAPQSSVRSDRFTDRELQVIAALQQGHSNKWIASELSLSENTVKVYIKQIMRKLKATNRTQAAIYSQEIGNRALG